LAALVPAAFTGVLFLALHVVDARDLTALPSGDAAMRRYAEAGYFPLQAAANAAGRHALATVAGLQTFAALSVTLLSAAYGGWRGYANPRARGWTNAFWIGGVAAICLAPSLVHGLTPQTLDYALGSMGPGAVEPAFVLLKRGAFAAAAAAFFLFLGHDMGYRLREALEDFGVIEVDAARARREKPKPFRGKGWSRRFTADFEPAGAEAGGFGARDAHHPPPENDAAARARAVLGVSLTASKREIERAYRSQMKRAHPDHGGSVERAAALNAARDVLLGK
jgi:hypothetical protein